ncbi:DUF2897 family protein [Rheinheimera riviphila]|uniref:DUF2897 family protein n=1 Tax=Rheinheimera riviphila TaxID=1834037 RepID=A0A437R364_9GAMM|nr:DUF2897 family protein [Rheinheimera riviphila]RVU41172.1 DUF2897 family protein [Rheinheimera riviphila]
MSLTFILILLLVIGIVFANIALLRHGSKPMPLKDKKPLTPDTTAAPGKTQAATTSAVPLTTTPSTEANKNTAEQSKPDTHTGSNVSSNGGSDNGSAGD